MPETPAPDTTPAPETTTPENGVGKGKAGEKLKKAGTIVNDTRKKVQGAMDSTGEKAKNAGKSADEFAQKHLRYGKDGEAAETYFGKDNLPLAIAKTVKDNTLDVLDGTLMPIPRRYWELANVTGGIVSNATSMALSPIIHPWKTITSPKQYGKKIARTGTLAGRALDASAGIITRTLREVGNRAIRRPLERLEGPGLAGITIGKIMATTGRAIGAVTGFAANQQDKVGDKLKEWDDKLADNKIT